MLFAFQLIPVQSQSIEPPPPSYKDNIRETIHGVEIVDPYRWLENQESRATRVWLDAQIRYMDSLIDDLECRKDIRKRLEKLNRIDRIGMPTERGGLYFISKRRAKDDLSILYVRKGLHGKDEVLIDPHKLSEDLTTTVSTMDISDDGKLMAYGIRRGGEDEVEVRIMDVETRKDLPDRLPKAFITGFSFKKDKSGFYYGIRDLNIGCRVYYHAMGTDPSEDKLIFGEGQGPEVSVGGWISEDGRYLILGVWHGWTKSEIYIQNIETGGPIIPIVNDIDAQFDVAAVGDKLIMKTDWNAPNERILVVDLKNPSSENWREIIPEGPDAMTGYSLVGGKMFVHYLHNVSSQIKIFDLDGKQLGELELPGIGSAGLPSGRWESSEAFFGFNSFTTPYTIYRYDVATGEKEVWSQLKIPVKTDKFEVKQVWYESKDGTKIPMFIIHKKGLKLDGKRPTMLGGYGGFNVSCTPGFDSRAVMWAEEGGVWAIANLRGGGEFGEAWHRAGMLDKKQNVFDDFIAAAEWLIDNGYTNPDKLAIHGGSNGGLLVGAVMTQRPDLYRVVVCGVPLLDMLRYHKFLLGPIWVGEYGSADDPEQFEYLRKYSPYHNVKEGTAYPAVIFVTGDSDTRVAPLHARKMAALLQNATSAKDRPIVLLYDTKSGHSGGKPMTKYLDDLAKETAFVYWQLGMDKKQDNGGNGSR